MSLGAGAGVTRSRGPTCGDATVEPAKARRHRPLRISGVRSPEGPLFRPATRPLGMRPGRMPSVTDTQLLGITTDLEEVTA
jgi:hypothetical protein